ncbi:hypothetical protein BKA58DRAFT_148325 [Alternaria rosae]|uniref:uncharacterized protein n=1 Tax=Alternaria rosae TaxID=1187941 RepID=UPI001E8CBAEE|nr:uncharacterized protein BKA58DRAFT_148325 [Alternaria rosae]KAH6872576.1 hypothetical protein BKA58DRAFT_148325 [Alternaria rosae]
MMQPCPPLPARVEETRVYSEYASGVIPEPKPINLQFIHPNGPSRQASWFFSIEEDDEIPTSLDTDSRALYDRLVEFRQKVANEEEMYPGQLTTDCTLRHIASTRLATTDECIKLRMIFPQLRKLVGKKYAKVVNSFQEEMQQRDSEREIQHASAKNKYQDKSLQIGGDVNGTVPDLPQTLAEEAGQAHAGLSFSMAETGIAIDEHTGGDTEPESDANETNDISAHEASIPTHDPSADVEQNQDSDKHKDDIPLKRKRSLSLQIGRQPPMKSS